MFFQRVSRVWSGYRAGGKANGLAGYVGWGEFT